MEHTSHTVFCLLFQNMNLYSKGDKGRPEMDNDRVNLILIFQGNFFGFQKAVHLGRKLEF